MIVPVTSLSDLRGKVAELRTRNTKRGAFIFRGLRSSYELKTTLERSCARAGKPISDMREYERLTSREFERRFHHYSVHAPSSSCRLEWLALMQHHGAPTRLLDWTYSLEVAAYFALKSAAEAGDSAAVWAMDASWAHEETAATFRRSGKHGAADLVLRNLWNAEDEARLAKVLLSEDARFAYPVNPYRLNERLTLQHGIFVCPGDLTVSFEENLRAMPGSSDGDHVSTFVMPPSETQCGLETLHEMNISDATLFPGLDGFARSLDINLRLAAPRVPI